MLFSYIGEIGLIIVGFLYVMDLWFDSYIDLIQATKEKEEKQTELPESIKHMYS